MIPLCNIWSCTATVRLMHGVLFKPVCVLKCSSQLASNWVVNVSLNSAWRLVDAMRQLRVTIIDITQTVLHLWLRPRWHTTHEHRSQAPHPISQVGGHCWRSLLPPLD